MVSMRKQKPACTLLVDVSAFGSAQCTACSNVPASDNVVHIGNEVKTAIIDLTEQSSKAAEPFMLAAQICSGKSDVIGGAFKQCTKSLL